MIGVDAENLCFECCYYGALGPYSLCWRDIEEPKPIDSLDEACDEFEPCDTCGG